MALALVALVVLAPGIPAAGVLYPSGRLALPTRIALSFALGIGVAGTIAFALALAGLLYPGTFFGLWAVATAALLAASWRRTGPRARLRDARDEVRSAQGVIHAKARRTR